MDILELLNTCENWKDILTKHNVKIKYDGKYMLLKYGIPNPQDFIDYPWMRECRGSIFVQEDGKWKYVCRPFDKFGNLGECYAATLDWNHIIAQEKVDGSLIKVWFYDSQWHVSTNGTIDAYEAYFDGCNTSFGSLCDKAVKGKFNFRDIFYSYYTNPNHTYMFELVSPETRLTIPYNETKLYFLSERDNMTGNESSIFPFGDNNYGILQPYFASIHTLDEAREIVSKMGADEEGFVIRDAYFNRVKLKSEAFLELFHFRGNNNLTMKRICEAWQEGKLDDLSSVFPGHSLICHFNDILIGRLSLLFMAISSINENTTAKEIAISSRFTDFEKTYLFAYLKNKDLTPYDYFKNMPKNKFYKLFNY